VIPVTTQHLPPCPYRCQPAISGLEFIAALTIALGLLGCFALVVGWMIDGAERETLVVYLRRQGANLRWVLGRIW
jgi:hypothetical protein